MADDLTETMDDLKDEIKRLTEKIPIVASYRQFQAGALPPSRDIGNIPAEEIAWGMGGAGVVRGAGAIGSAAWQSAKAKAAGGVVQTYFPSGATLRMPGSIGSAAEIAAAERAIAPELAALHQVSKPVISRVGTAAPAEAAGAGLFTRGMQALGGAREAIFGTPRSSLYYGTREATGGLLGRAGRFGKGAIYAGALGIAATGLAAILSPEVREEFPGAEAVFPPAVLAGTAIWGGVEEAPQQIGFPTGAALRAGDVETAAMGIGMMEKASANARVLLDELGKMSPTMALMGEAFLESYNNSIELNKRLLEGLGAATPEGREAYAERKGLKEDLAFEKEALGIEKAQLAMLTTEYDVNKESIKEWTTVRFAGETVAQESIQNVKYEILEQQKLALAYSSTLDEIEAYRTTRSNLSDEMTLGIATTNLEMVNEAKGSAQKERLTVDLEKLRAEKQLHTAQTAVTVGEMQTEMSSYNDVQLKIGELQNTLSGLETDYSLKFERMRNDVKFFVQAHEDASSILPESAQVVVDALSPLLSRQDEVNTSIENFKTSISDKEGTIISYRTQIQALTADLNALAAAQGQSIGVPGVSAPSAPAPAYSEEYTTSPYGSDWASAGGHFDEFGRRISVVPVYTS